MKNRALSDLDVLVVDCQTSGASPSYGQMIEVGWGRICADEFGDGGVCQHVESRLIQLRDGESLSHRVTELTGITRDMLENGEPEGRVWELVQDARSETDAMLAHYARFERRFFDDVAMRQDGAVGMGQETWICTHQIAKRLYPGLPRRGLRALAGFFGRPMREENRAGPHVAATMGLWGRLVEELEARGVKRVGDLKSWLATDPVDPEKRTYALSREKRLALPDKPGVYELKDAVGETLYIGKATSLRERVNQYFQTKRGLSNKKLELVSQVHDVDQTATATPLEAALLESERIKDVVPSYNESLQTADRRMTDLGRLPNGKVDTAVELAGIAVEQLRLPESQSQVVAAFAALVESVEQRRVADQLAEAVDTEHVDDERPLSEAVEAYRERMVGDPRCVGSGYAAWMRYGAELRRERRERESDTAESEIRLFADEFDSLVRHGTRLVGRAIWLLRLSGGAVAWRPSRWDGAEAAGWRVIGFDGAEVALRATFSEEETMKKVQGWGGDQEAVGTVRAYDRLRVMTTELKRLSRNGAEVVVGIAGGEVAGAEALGACLRQI